MAAANLDKIVQAYTAIGDARAVRSKAFQEKDDELKGEQVRLKAFMLDVLNQNGAKSIATNHGTEKLRPSAADWGAIWDWAKENDGFEIVEKRLKTAFIKEYMEQHDGAVPPGINVHREYEVNVRRPGSAPSKED